MALFPHSVSYLVQVNNQILLFYKISILYVKHLFRKIQARVSLNRISDFLLKEEIEKDDIIYKETKTGIQKKLIFKFHLLSLLTRNIKNLNLDDAIIINDCDFGWNKTEKNIKK